MDFMRTVGSHVLDVLAFIGSAAATIIYFVPVLLGFLLLILILNYRDDLKYKRILYSRIKEIDALSPTKLKVFMPTFLNLMGYLPAVEQAGKDSSEQDINDHPEDEGAAEETARDEAEKPREIKQYEQQGRDRGKDRDRGKGRGRIPEKPMADALVKKDGLKYAVMIDRNESGISPLIFSRLEKAMQSHDCERGIIIKNGYFSFEELEQGRLRSLEMWDRDRLIKELLYLQGKEDPKDQPFFFYIGDFFRWLVRG